MTKQRGLLQHQSFALAARVRWLLSRKGAINCAALAFVASLPALALAADESWQARVGEALGKTGSQAPAGIYRVGLPRTDLKVTLDGVELKPGFALGGVARLRKDGRGRHGYG